jgi:hypothetical protein
MLDMDPGIRARWTAALRSGDYQQGTMCLNREGNLCCLGVLCELAAADGIVAASARPSGKQAYDDQVATLPEAVQDWAGLRGCNPMVTAQVSDLGPIPWNLSDLNDEAHWTFAQIADAIDGGAPA